MAWGRGRDLDFKACYSTTATTRTEHEFSFQELINLFSGYPCAVISGQYLFSNKTQKNGVCVSQLTCRY